MPWTWAHIAKMAELARRMEAGELVGQLCCLIPEFKSCGPLTDGPAEIAPEDL